MDEEFEPVTEKELDAPNVAGEAQPIGRRLHPACWMLSVRFLRLLVQSAFDEDFSPARRIRTVRMSAGGSDAGLDGLRGELLEEGCIPVGGMIVGKQPTSGCSRVVLPSDVVSICAVGSNGIRLRSHDIVFGAEADRYNPHFRSTQVHAGNEEHVQFPARKDDLLIIDVGKPLFDLFFDFFGQSLQVHRTTEKRNCNF